MTTALGRLRSGALAPRVRPQQPAGPLPRRGFEALLAAGCVLLGGAYAWVGARRQLMNEDGMSYLDMADAYLRGDWGEVVNAAWSPLYSAFLAAGLGIIRPGPPHEFVLVHSVNFVIYLLALGCFAHFWRELGRYRDLRAASGSGSPLSGWPWSLAGYGLFAWCTLALITIWAVTPDMLVAALVFLAAALILRIARGDATIRGMTLLGLVLGIGYLAKTVLLPLGLVFLVVGVVSARGRRQRIRGGLAAAATFLVISAPLVGALSLEKGRFTIGDSGRITYARYVNDVPYVHWQGDPEGSGVPRHPTRQIWDDPPVFEFAGPVGGTYPPGYDPTYWYEGLEPRFVLDRQLAAVASNGAFYADLQVRQQGWLLVFLVLLFLIAPAGTGSALRGLVRDQWPLLVPAAAAFGLYALVFAVPRYVAPFLLLFWAGLLAAVRLPEGRLAARGPTVAGIVLALGLGANFALFNLDGLRTLSGGGAEGENASAGMERVVAADAGNDPAWDQRRDAAWATAGTQSWEVAEALRAAGLRAGDPVAVVGYGFGAYWARLARLRIVAEVPYTAADRFWAASASVHREIRHRLAREGVRAIVAEKLPERDPGPAWRFVPGTGFMISFLDAPGPPPPVGR